ncbi:hypothetical protein GCM10017556_47240 [Micromonospora sagamiensis]|nr:hypothetical protein GCM10017556_47240 [Micromonospora sagamiensis]
MATWCCPPSTHPDDLAIRQDSLPGQPADLAVRFLASAVSYEKDAADILTDQGYVLRVPEGRRPQPPPAASAAHRASRIRVWWFMQCSV